MGDFVTKYPLPAAAGLKIFQNNEENEALAAVNCSGTTLRLLLWLLALTKLIRLLTKLSSVCNLPFCFRRPLFNNPTPSNGLDPELLTPLQVPYYRPAYRYADSSPSQ